MGKTSLFAAAAICAATFASDYAIGAVYAEDAYYGRGTSSRRADPFQYYDSDGGSFYGDWIKGKLSIGLTLSALSLTHNKRPPNREEDFLGNINELKKEGGTQVAPVISYQPIDYLIFGLSYTKVEARTMNFNNSLSDGNATLKGPVFTMELSYPLFEKIVLPHVGLGIASLSGDFSEDGWWGAGYGSPEDYESTGHDNNRYGRHRYIDVDDESCAFLNLGVAVKPVSHLSLDVSYRHLSLDPDCRFGYRSGKRKMVESSGDFDMSCKVFLFSASYVF